MKVKEEDRTMGFLGGALSGYANTAAKMRDKDGDDGKGKKPSLGSRVVKRVKTYVGGMRKPNASPKLTPDVPYDYESFKRGGKVKKTGFAKVHKGERVLTKKQQRGMGMKMKHRGRRGRSAKR